MIDYIPPTSVHFPEDDIRTIQAGLGEILRSGRLTLGEHTKEFETSFAAYCGTQHAIATSSGTSALEIVLRALRLEDCSVIVPTNTFFATAAAVVHASLRPIFVDCDETLSLDMDSLRAAVTPDTKAVIVVHIGGFISPRIDEIVAFCQERNLYLIEDAAHAHGSSFEGRRAGTFGHAATFSFYPTKVMTSGEGGMIVTDDEQLSQLACGFRDQGKTNFTANVHDELGYNWRMSEPHALIGKTHLARLDEFIATRRSIAAIYDRGLSTITGIEPLREAPGVFSNYYKYCAFVRGDRAQLKKQLKEQHQIGLAGEVYELPLHKQPVFSGYSLGARAPNAERLCATHVCLPMSAVQTESEAQRVVESLSSALTGSNVSALSTSFYVNPQKQRPMKVAVIGGSGFIGSHVIDKLLDAGHEPVVFDIMRPRRDDVWHVNLDILNASTVNTFLTGGFDAVYMMAAMANVNDVYNNPVEACDVNIRALVNVLEAARKNKIPRVFLSSTVWVYEMIDGKETIATEESLLHPHHVNHVYTATKLAAEQYCVAYHKLYDQDYTILRYGIPYGPRGRGGTGIANFVNNALNGKPMIILGDGSLTRNFIYVEDLAEGNVAALQTQAANQTYNLDGLRQVTVKEVAEIVQSLIPDSEIEYKEARPGDFKGFSASYKKANRELGWEPRIDIRDGIARYIAWVREQQR